MTMRATRLAGPLLALASVVVTLLLVEGSLRLARWLRGPVEGGLVLYAEHDPVLGWRKRPGAEVLFRTPEYTVTVRINRSGLRDPERGYEAPPGTTRVLGLGDSFVEGYTVPLEQTVTQVLEQTLNTQGCRVEVVNGATTGYSTDQEYLFYDREGVRYSPRVVLLFFYYNDVRYNVYAAYRRPRFPKPVFEYRDGRLVLQNVPVPPLPPPERPTGAAEQAGPSLLYDVIGARLRIGAPDAYARLAFWGFFPPVASQAPPDELKVYKRKAIPALEYAWTRTAQILEALVRDVEAHGARPLVVYVPTVMEVDERAWDLTRATYGLQESQWDRGRVLARLREIARSLGLPLLDLTPNLRAANSGWLGGPYYPRDGHWNASGHRVAARDVAAFLQGSGWLACEVGRGRDR
jgi:lysophospholipase L1-like esterase